MLYSQSDTISLSRKSFKEWLCVMHMHMIRIRLQLSVNKYTSLLIILYYDLCKTPLNFTQHCSWLKLHSLSRMKADTKNSSKRLSDHHWLHQSIYWRNQKTSQSRILSLLSLNQVMEKSKISFKESTQANARSLQK